ncbi:MAG: hypothetical protein AAGI30_11410 [Planctomycetota bacterium]
MNWFVGCGACAAVLLSAGAVGADGLRVVTWNITNYRGGLIEDIQTVAYSTFVDRTLAADVFLLQEFHSTTSLNDFVQAVNTAPGSPGDWEPAPFVLSRDTENACVYRSSKLEFIETFQISKGGSNPLGPRDTDRFDFRLAGYPDGLAEAELSIYGVHLKASQGSTNETRRFNQAKLIRDNADGLDTNPFDGRDDALPDGRHFLLAGDLNVYRSTEPAYQELTLSFDQVPTTFDSDSQNDRSDNTGQLFDPINTPGNWNNSSAFRYVHSQDPVGGGGMDDRLDQILVGASLLDGGGMDYQGSYPIRFSTSTWNDPNHSYRTWGNDGSSFNSSLRTQGNIMVGAQIAESIIRLADNSGHLPVYLDLVVPAVLSIPDDIDLGEVTLGDSVDVFFEIGSGGDAALWGAGGVEATSYAVHQTVPEGPFAVNGEDAAGGGLDVYQYSFDAEQLGAQSVTFLVTSNDPAAPTETFSIFATVVEPPLEACPGDTDFDADVDAADFIAVLVGFGSSDADRATGDLDGDGSVGVSDFIQILTAFGKVYGPGCSAAN